MRILESKEKCAMESKGYKGDEAKEPGLADQVGPRATAVFTGGVAAWQVTGTFTETPALGGSF